MRRLAGTYFWPQTRIRRRGRAVSQYLKMRLIFKRALVYLVIFLAFALGFVWTRVQVVETGYELRQLEEAREKLKEENRALMVEAAMLRSPQRLEKEAARMGLKRPRQNQVHFLKANGEGFP